MKGGYFSLLITELLEWYDCLNPDLIHLILDD